MNVLQFLKRGCPSCKEGRMFGAMFKMHPRCPSCDLDFEPEQGYYTGAMFINYFFATFTIVPIALVLLLREVPFWQTMLITLALTLLSIPFFFQYSRALWLHIDYHFTGLIDRKP